VTYYPDGSPYEFLPEARDGAVNVGWLDASQPFPTGAVPAEFVDRLTELCRHAVNRTRGFHRCGLCPPPDGSRRWSAELASPEGAYPLGSAEMRIDGTNGVRYAAPDLIAHYVTEHGYRPPAEFIAAVLAENDR
jgi:hypothetical protein